MWNKFLRNMKDAREYLLLVIIAFITIIRTIDLYNKKQRINFPSRFIFVLTTSGQLCLFSFWNISFQHNILRRTMFCVPFRSIFLYKISLSPTRTVIAILLRTRFAFNHVFIHRNQFLFLHTRDIHYTSLYVFITRAKRFYYELVNFTSDKWKPSTRYGERHRRELHD